MPTDPGTAKGDPAVPADAVWDDFFASEGADFGDRNQPAPQERDWEDARGVVASIDQATEDLALNGPVSAKELRQALRDLEVEWRS